MTDLGRKPARVDVHVQRGYPFRQSLKTADGSTWPPLELRFESGAAWPATVTGDTATWDVPAVDVAVPSRGAKVTLVYGSDVVWAEGRLVEDSVSGINGYQGTLTIPVAGGGQVIASPAIKGDQGETPTLVGGTTTTLAPGAAAEATLVPVGGAEYRLDLAIPQGEAGGTDAATAMFVTSGTETPTAVVELVSTPQVEYRPLYVSGHSWVDGDTSAAQWWQRIASRVSSPSATMAGYSGRTVGDVALLALSGTGSWAARTRAFVMAVCTINDITIFQGTAASRRGYQYAWRSLLSQFTSNYITAANTANVVYSPDWSKVTVSRTTGQATSTNSTGGAVFRTTTVGRYFEFAATGQSVDVVLLARAAGAGLATATVAGTTVGTLDLTLATAQDTPAVMRLRNLGAGTRTIRVTLTSGASLTLDSIRIPAANPTSGVVIGEPNITATNYGAYLTDLASFKTDLAAIVADYPTFEWCDLATKPGFTAATMLYDGKHPSDIGASWTAFHVLNSARDTPWTAGLHKLTTAPDAEYVPPTPPAIPTGGQPGAGPIPPIMTDTPPYTGTTDTGGYTWATISGGTPAHDYTTVTTTNPNVIVKATLSAIDPDAVAGQVTGGIAFRVGDIDNGIHLSVRTDVYAFTRFNAGVHATLNATATSVVPTVGDVLELRGNGNVVECWVNGAKLYEHLSLSAGATNVQHGFMSTALTSGTTFSDVSITPN